jgi:peptidoglycan/LPS O-acetylase OafA/YrhL
LSTMLVWCLDVLVVIAHVFEMLIPTQPTLFLIMESIVVLLFVGSGLFIVKRYRYSQVELMARNR